METILKKYLNEINKVDTSSTDHIQDKLNNLTKPLESLGRIEELALRLCLITSKESPTFSNRMVFIMASDNGIVDEGVSAYPKEVTPQMVYNFLDEGAAINVLARHADFDVNVVDIGVAENIASDSPRYINQKIAFGTRNFLKESAMSKEEAIKSIVTGIECVLKKNRACPLDIIATGDMGIGNTTPSSAVAAVLTNSPAEEVTGYGTGIDEEKLKHKIAIIKKGIALHNPDPNDAVDVLRKVGSFEIGGIAGLILGAAMIKIPVIVDGFISQAGALVAASLKREAVDYIIPSHQSAECGSQIIWKHLGLLPYFQLNMRLGEGTGAVLVSHLVDASTKVLNEMASFDKAGVSKKI